MEKFQPLHITPFLFSFICVLYLNIIQRSSYSPLHIILPRIIFHGAHSKYFRSKYSIEAEVEASIVIHFFFSSCNRISNMQRRKSLESQFFFLSLSSYSERKKKRRREYNIFRNKIQNLLFFSLDFFM